MNTNSKLAQPGPLGRYSDAAHRFSEAVTVHLLAQGIDIAGQWIAARLSDGGTDGHLYPDKATAVRHQLHEFQCAYMRLGPDRVTPQEAEIFLTFNRKLYDNGYRMPNPDHHIHMPHDIRLEDLR